VEVGSVVVVVGLLGGWGDGSVDMMIVVPFLLLSLMMFFFLVDNRLSQPLCRDVNAGELESDM